MNWDGSDRTTGLLNLTGGIDRHACQKVHYLRFGSSKSIVLSFPHTLPEDSEAESFGSIIVQVYNYLSRNVWKRAFGHVLPAKIQISLRIRAV